MNDLTIDANRILANIGYRDWTIEAIDFGSATYLQVRFKEVNPATGKMEPWGGRKWLLSPHMTASEVVQTAFKAVMTAEEHETRERFTFRGRAIFGPHIDVIALWAASPQLDARKEPVFA